LVSSLLDNRDLIPKNIGTPRLYSYYYFFSKLYLTC